MTTNGDNNYFFPWDNEEGLEGQLDDDTDGDEVGVYRKKRVKLSRSFLERIANHDLIHATEIEKLFAPTKLDQDYIIGSTLSRGFVGFILSLEGALVDVTKLYEECYRTFIKEAMHGQKKEQLPSKATIHDIIGLTFQDASVEMQIGIPKESLVDAELEFYSLMNRILDDWFDHNPDAIKAQKGSFALIEHLLKDHNELAVQSNLPREIAQRLLGHTGLADLLADKGISIEQFVPYPFPYQINDDQDFNDDHKERSLLDHAKRPMSTEYDNYDDMVQNFYAPMHGDRFQINQYLRCCAKLQSIPSMSVLIDSNRKNIVTAKRIGIPCIAVKGNALNAQSLRGADMIIDDLTHLNMHRSYQLVKSAMKASIGPSAQFEAPPLRVQKPAKVVANVLDTDEKGEQEDELLPERPDLYRRPLFNPLQTVKETQTSKKHQSDEQKHRDVEDMQQ